MLAVHDVVARRELERVDAAAPPAGHPAAVPAADPLPGDVVLAEHGQLDIWPDKPRVEQTGGDDRDAGLGHPSQVAGPGSQVLAAEQFG